VFDPSIDTSGRSVAYAQGAGTCAAGIYSVPLAGGAPTELVDASRGAASDPSLNDSWLAYTLTRCNTAGDTSGDIVELLLRDLDSGEETRLATAVGANAEFSSPSWSPDGNRLAVVAAGVEGGAEARVHIYDLDQLRTPTEVGASQGCAVLAVAWMTVPGRVGSRPVTSQYCGPEGSRQARLYDSYGLPDAERAPLAVRGEIPITTLDVDVTGQHLLWSASIRNRGIEVWRWDGTTDPTRVPSAPNLEYPTW
jgi:hypothetical protein